MAELEHLGGKRAESARVRRAEQLRRWRGSQTEQEPAERQPRTRRGAPRVRFEDGAVFLAACSSGDTDEVKRLLARGADINTANVDGLTALHQVTRGARGAGPRPPTASPRARLCPPGLRANHQGPRRAGVWISLHLLGLSWLLGTWSRSCRYRCFAARAPCRRAARQVPSWGLSLPACSRQIPVLGKEAGPRERHLSFRWFVMVQKQLVSCLLQLPDLVPWVPLPLPSSATSPGPPVGSQPPESLRFFDTTEWAFFLSLSSFTKLSVDSTCPYIATVHGLWMPRHFCAW